MGSIHSRQSPSHSHQIEKKTLIYFFWDYSQGNPSSSGIKIVLEILRII